MRVCLVVFFYRLFVAHSHVFDPCGLSGHGHLYDGNTDYPEHVLHVLQGEEMRCYRKPVEGGSRCDRTKGHSAFSAQGTLDCATLEL